MNSKLLAELKNGHLALRSLYDQAAGDACRSGAPWEVYDLWKKAMEQERMVRQLDVRYGK